jgi:cytochrome d ubiquinol oxidase subunit II
MTSLGNIWDANETWLVLMGGALFGAFPLAYGTILSALYIPIIYDDIRADFSSGGL